MELKQLVKQFSYRIEAKPEGGFIARSTDPAIPPLQASTREELQRQIAEKFSAALAESFPGLKIPVQGKTSKFEFHIEGKPGGGFSVHSTELGGSTASPVDHEKMDHFAEVLLGFVDKRFPELKQTLIEKAVAQGQLSPTEQGEVPPTLAALVNARNLPPTDPTNVVATVTTSISRNGEPFNGSLGDVGRIIDNNPITPQSGGNWKLFRFLLVALGLAVFLYIVLRHG